MNCTICKTSIPEGSGVCPKCEAKRSALKSQKVPLWKRPKTLMGLTCVLGLWMISGIVGQLSSSSVVEIALVDALPAKEVHEERFLLFLLEHELDTIHFYSRLEPETAAPAIVETKAGAQSIVSHLQHHPIESPAMRGCFQKVVELADAYEAMVSELGVMKVAAKGADGQQALTTMAKGVGLGYATTQMLDTGDGAGLVVGGVLGLAKIFYDNREVEASRKAQIEQVTNSFYSQVDQARADAVVVADEVAQKHSWDRASVGFVRDQKPYGQEQFERHSRDLPPVLADLVRQKPLNPILQFHSIRLEDYYDGDSTSQQKLLEWSAKFIDLARLAPSGTVYDLFRWRYIMRAGEMALRAAEQEGKGKKLGENSKAAITSASCWKTALSINESDPGGELRWGYGQSLALAGRLDEARAVLSQIRDHISVNPDYHYLLARLCAVNDEADKALDHLKAAVEKGLTKIAEARKCQDLENLRKANGDQVDALLAVKFGWSVKYGLFNDDITITNQSTFPLTQLVFRPVISNNKGSFTPKQQLTLEKLDPGKSHTWVNCISVSGGGDNDTRKAELQCDQSS